VGLRGPQAPRIFREAEELEDTRPPDFLGKEGKAFWHRHCAWLMLNDLLNEATADSFAVLCQLWELLHQELPPREYVSIVGKFNTMSRVFRLQPVEKLGQPTTEEFVDEFSS
jgi:phage terminase small subunit